jgi:hypothetical protein
MKRERDVLRHECSCANEYGNHFECLLFTILEDGLSNPPKYCPVTGKECKWNMMVV